MTTDYGEASDAFVEAAEKQGHKLFRDEDGDIDHFVRSGGYCNGPGCSVCMESWCEHCRAPDSIEPCDGGVAHRLRVAREDREEWARLVAEYGPAGPPPASGIEAAAAGETAHD